MKRNIWFFSLSITGVIVLLLMLLATSCKKDEDKTPIPSSGIIFNPNLTYGTVTDIDGNVYKTITIGTQTWMAENLKVSKYRNGDPIPKVTDDTAWNNLTTGAYCDYNNTPNNSTTYGKLYNWYAVNDSRSIAPKGWHVPSDDEWTILTEYLGGDSVAGGKLKETGSTHWNSINTGSTNETGFTALPGGYRNYDSKFSLIKQYGYWWSSTENCTSDAYYRCIFYSNIDVFRHIYVLVDGFSVRCVRDN
jgi:uncharacterized protein (TIGR02145 family)